MIIDIATDELKPIVLADDGDEVSLSIKYAATKETKAGDKLGLNLVFEAEDSDIENVSWWTEVYSEKRKEEDPKGYQTTLRRQIKFAQAFDFTWPIDDEDLPGHTGRAVLGHTESEEYGAKNTIKSFVPTTY